MFLPNEILDDIFQRVDYPTLRNARLAGRQVHEAASEVFFSRWTFDIGHSLEDCSYRMKGVANTRHLGQIRGVVASARGTLPEILPDSEVSFRQAMKRRIKQSTIDDSSKVSGFKVNREYLRILCRQYAVTYFWHLKRLLSSVAPHLEKLYIVADCDPDPDDKTRGYLANVSGSFFIKMLTSTLISVELPSLSFTRVDFHGVLCQFFPNERSLRRNTPSLSDSELHNLRSFLGSIQYIGIKVGSLHEMLPDPDAVPTVYGTVSEDNYAISLLDIKCVTSVAKKLKTIAFDYTGHDYLGYRLSDADFTGYQEKCVRNANFSTVTFLRDITRWDLNHRNIPNFVLRSIIIDNVCLRLETFMNRWQQWGWGDVFNAILNERSLQTVTDLRLSRLSYFFLVNSRYPEEMRISGWPYLRPLITSIDADLEAFQRLRDGLIERREEAGLEKDEWLSDFCMLPEVMKKISEDDAEQISFKLVKPGQVSAPSIACFSKQNMAGNHELVIFRKKHHLLCREVTIGASSSDGCIKKNQIPFTANNEQNLIRLTSLPAAPTVTMRFNAIYAVTILAVSASAAPTSPSSKMVDPELVVLAELTPAPRIEDLDKREELPVWHDRTAHDAPAKVGKRFHTPSFISDLFSAFGRGTHSAKSLSS